MVAEPRVCVGVIVGAHGIKGEVKIKPFTETPDAIAAYGKVQSEDGVRQFQLRITGAAKGMVIAKIKGVVDRNAAEALAKTSLYIAREQLPPLPEGQYYLRDLTGLQALDQNGAVVATVTSAMNFGAGDIVALQPVAGFGARFGDGKEFMLPLKAPFVDAIDLKARTLRIDVPVGFFKDEKPDE